MSDTNGLTGGRFHVNPIAMLLAIVALAATGCGGPGPTSQGQAAQSAVPSGPKTLRLGWDREPLTLFTGSGGNTREYREIFNAGLTYLDAAGTVQPKLAVKVPSIADGDW